jgi:hypothetical protein
LPVAYGYVIIAAGKCHADASGPPDSPEEKKLNRQDAKVAKKSRECKRRCIDPIQNVIILRVFLGVLGAWRFNWP